MSHRARCSLVFASLICIGVVPAAQAQLVCPGNNGSGDQGFGTTLGPNEQADA